MSIKYRVAINEIQFENVHSHFLSQAKRVSRLLETSEKNPVNKVLFTDRRAIFSWIRAAKDKPKVDRRPTVCGEPLPERLQPCNPECPSKCLQISGCDDKELAMRRLSNCRDTEKTAKPKSYWETLFGWKPEVEEPPDPRTCRIAQREKERARQCDPRMRDPRYEATAGDVFIFTEYSKPEVRGAQEPRPRPPPSYKLPKAVLTMRISKETEKTAHACPAAVQFQPSCDSKKCALPKAPILPFSEMRPPESQRKIFYCREGLRSRDVDKPLRRDSNACCMSKQAGSSSAHATSSKSDSTAFSVDRSRASSRMEQLKKLIRARDGNKCSEVLTGDSASINVSRCRTLCSPSYREMSTSTSGYWLYVN